MFVNLVKLDKFIAEKFEENLVDMGEVSIYEINCNQLNKKLKQLQEANSERLYKFIEKHLDKIAT